MLRTFALAVALVSVAIVATPASAATSEEKGKPAKSVRKASSCREPSATPSSRSAWRAAITSPLREGTPRPHRSRSGRRSSGPAPPAARAVSRRSGDCIAMQSLGHPRRGRLPLAVALKIILSSRIRSSTPVTGIPSARTMVSRVISPAKAAGPCGSSAVIIAPDEFSIPATRAWRRGTAVVCADTPI